MQHQSWDNSREESSSTYYNDNCFEKDNTLSNFILSWKNVTVSIDNADKNIIEANISELKTSTTGPHWQRLERTKETYSINDAIKNLMRKPQNLRIPSTGREETETAEIISSLIGTEAGSGLLGLLRVGLSWWHLDPVRTNRECVPLFG